MLEILFISIVGFVVGVGLSKTAKEYRDRKALRGGDLTLEKKLIAATVKLEAAQKENDDMRGYLGLNPVRREALVDDEPVVSKKTRAKKKASGSSPSVEDLKGLGPGSGPLPMIMLMVIGTAMIADQQKKKSRPRKSKDLKDLKARLEKKVTALDDVSKRELIESYSKIDARARGAQPQTKAHPAEPFSKSDMSLMELKRRLSEKSQDQA